VCVSFCVRHFGLTERETTDADDLSGFGLLGPDDREIDLGLHGDVKIIRQDVDRHMCDDFGNLRLRKPCLLQPAKIGVADASTFLQQ
jgi:hypothetical protein